jgi:hypothetical protein
MQAGIQSASVNTLRPLPEQLIQPFVGQSSKVYEVEYIIYIQVKTAR